ncbi:branched-chain amino acid ABC transporter permease [Neobacillus cucumis]|uniref:branched-chain amino acid ABC transporter permease n=1 Tax=Neobacillus cucumis TaxID=1740721 RepID=UPI0018DF21A8|nr:branched-chain amino acid ABC transporter permease [Neobacillus cucumis]MBI0577173.1 branched-chain amino acid ABC transporter permease [Neobacillus cucumis]WHY94231.1 branched-chain amino acid ABC transporter permease [Neobacillus cucumis]
MDKTVQKNYLKIAALGVLVFVMACLPLISDNYWIDVALMALIYIILALGLNIVVGYCGLLDLGFSAFFAVGAYTTGILMTQYHLSFWISIIASAILSAIAGVIIGAPTLRLRSDYLAIVTLGFGEIVRISAINLHFTGGASGIYGIPKPSIGSFQLTGLTGVYYLAFVSVILMIFIVRRLGDSRLGRAWKYIREDEDAAEAMGINRWRTKLLAYIFGAIVGGFGGSIFAVKMTAISPQSFSFNQSAMILLAVVLGGIGRIPGVVLGAVFVILLPEVMRDFSDWRLLIFGGLLVVMMIFRPEGIWPSAKERASASAGKETGADRHVAG